MRGIRASVRGSGIAVGGSLPYRLVVPRAGGSLSVSGEVPAGAPGPGGRAYVKPFKAW